MTAATSPASAGPHSAPQGHPAPPGANALVPHSSQTQKKRQGKLKPVQLPVNGEAEEQLVAAVLTNNQLMAECPRLLPEHFASYHAGISATQAIWEIALERHQAGQAFDEVIVPMELTKRGIRINASIITEWMMSALEPTPARVRYLAGEVLESYKLRQHWQALEDAGFEMPPLLSVEEPAALPKVEPESFEAEPDAPIDGATDWPEPEPLGGELPAVQAFDVDILPDALRPLVVDTGERMQVPLDYPAVVAVLCLAGVTNRRATIQPKAADTSWVVVPNLWGGIVAPPGLMKSPVMSAGTRPLTRIEALWCGEYESALSDYEQTKEEAELKQAAWRDLYKAAQKAGKDAPPRPDVSLVEPVAHRLITQDATAEKLHEMLSDNPAGLLVIRDELSGWLATLDKPGGEGERGFFLSAWNGDTPYAMDRIGRGSVHVAACCVSMLGGIQPARLRSYLVDALQDGPQNDGLFQRFQVLVYPDAPHDWQYVDRPPNSAAIADAAALYHRLAHLDAVEPLRFRFTPDAQELFIAWLTDLERKVRGDDLHPALVAHLSKYRSLMPSLALLFELADAGTEAVSIQHTQQAAACCAYLESHARRIYSMLVSPERAAAAELGRHLEAGWRHKEGMFTVRDVERNNWRGLTTPEDVRQALPLMVDAGWVRRVEAEQGKGRPTERYIINPKVAAGGSK